MNERIYILTGPVQSGKTTWFQKWIINNPATGGFLTPDMEGMRMFYDIMNDRYLPFQLQSLEDIDDIAVGRFIFSGKIFDLAKSLIYAASHEKFNHFIIDEVGKLELNNLGFEPALSAIINQYKRSDAEGKLMLVIRDYLLSEAIDKYQLQEAAIFPVNEPPYDL